MWLISPFKDFYDGVQRGDLERTPVYVRVAREERISTNDHARLRTFGPGGGETCGGLDAVNNLHMGVLFVCGKGFPYLTRRAVPTDGHYIFHTTGTATFFNLTDILEDAKEWDAAQQTKMHSRAWEKDARRFCHDPQKATLAWFAEAFSATAETHRAIDAPVFTLQVSVYSREVVLTRNPPLRQMDCMHLFHPAELWQTIDTYLGNEMATQVDPLPLDDVYRRDAHGFDATSFKQPAPGEKKARRAARKK